MQSTSASYKLEIKKPSRAFECRVTIGNNIFQNEDIVDIVLETTQSQDGYSIGATTSQTLDLMLINKGVTIYSTNQVKVEIGLKIGATTEYILMGYYNVDEVVKTDYTTKFTCYDNMIKFEKPYFSSLGATATLTQVVNELATMTGVQFIGSLPSYTVKKLEGFTCREILSYVASICGGNALITRDGKFTISNLNDIGLTVGASNYIDYKREEINYKIGKVSCQVGETILSKGSLGTDSMELQFENPWATDTIMTDIYNRLKTVEYLGYSMKWQGDLSLDPGDLITVTDIKGVVRKVPVLSQKFIYTGGLTSEIGGKGQSKNKNSFSSSGSGSNKINRIVTELLIVNEALINKANITDLEATNIRTQTLESKTAKIEMAIIKFATIEQLNVTNANITNLIAEDARINNAIITKASITDLDAAKGNITSLTSNVANINTLVNGNLTSINIQAGGVTSDKLTIANGFISNAMISNLDVAKINGGDISATKFRIVSDSGNMLIQDNTIQIRDSARVRVQIGKDASNDYNMYVWDNTGKLMFDATGLKADGIKNKIIRDDMVSDTANISGAKLNIASVVTSINGGTSVINSSKVLLDGTGQTLDVTFNSLKTQADGTKTQTESNSTTIGVMQGQITTAINNSQIVKDGQTILLKDDYNRTVQTVNSSSETIGRHESTINANTGSITSVTTDVTQVKKDLTGITQRLGSSETNITTVTTNTNKAIEDARLAKVQADKGVADALLASDKATNAQNTANTASTNANTANIKLGDIASDSKLTESEKKIAKKEWDIIVAEKSKIEAEGTKFGVSVTDYTAKYNTLNTYITPLLTSLNATSDIVGATFRLNFANYYNARQDLLNAITSKAKVLADTAQVQANLGVTNASTAQTQANKGVADALLAQTQANLGVANALLASNKAGQSLIDANAYTNAEITTVTNKVTSANSEIIQLKNQIALKVEATDITTAISNIQVGGRNLVKNSTFILGSNGFDSWRSITGVSIINAEADKPNSKIIKLNASGLTTNSIKSLASNMFTCTTGDTLTFSIDVKIDNFSAWDIKAPFIVEFYDVSGVRIQYQDVYITSMGLSTMENVKWYRVTLVTKITNALVVSGAIRPSLFRNGTLYMREPKVEMGNKNTDFTVAQEDTDQAIADTITLNTTNINQAKADITIETNAIKQSVSSVDSRVTTVTTTANNALTNASTAQTQANLGVANASTAQTQANKGVADALLAQTKANTVSQAVTDMSNDNILTPVEKAQLKKEWAVMVAEKPSYNSLATTYAITTENTNYNATYDNLNTALNNTTNGYFLNMTTNSTIVGTTFRALFDDYYDKKALLNKKVNELAKARADLGVANAGTAQVQANLGVTNASNAQTKANTVETTVATTNTKVATLETNLTNITSRVSATESTTTTINGTISSLNSRVTTAEQKITATAIVNTINESINNGTTSIKTVTTTLDKNGFTIYNGAIRVLDNSGNEVLKGDSSGNLSFKGRLQPSDNVIKLFGEQCLLDGSASALRRVFANGIYDSVDSEGAWRLFNQYSNVGTRYASIKYESDGHLSVYNTTTRLKLLYGATPQIQGRNTGDNAYVGFAGSAFINASKSIFKENIEDIKGLDFTDMLINNNVKQYNYTSEVLTLEELDREALELGFELEPEMITADTKVGLILEELTEDAMNLLHPTVSEGIDLYSMCSVLWKVCQEQQIKIEELTNKIEQLQLA